MYCVHVLRFKHVALLCLFGRSNVFAPFSLSALSRTFVWWESFLVFCFGLRWSNWRSHLLDSDLICNSSTLNVRHLLLVHRWAEFVNALMLIENLKFSKVLVTFLELHAFASVILHEFLPFTLDFKLSHALLLGLTQLFTHLILLLAHLPFQRLCLY